MRGRAWKHTLSYIFVRGYQLCMYQPSLNNTGPVTKGIMAVASNLDPEKAEKHPLFECGEFRFLALILESQSGPLIRIVDNARLGQGVGERV